MPYLVAETLAYYHADLVSFEPKSLKNNNIKFTESNYEHEDIINILVLLPVVMGMMNAKEFCTG